MKTTDLCIGKTIVVLKKIKKQIHPLRFYNYVKPTIQKIRKYGVPSHILFFGESLGDNLILTVIAKELYDRGHKNIWIKCDQPDLFKNNPFVKFVTPLNTTFSTLILSILGVKVVHPIYTKYEPLTDQDVSPNKHIILKMADCVDLKGNITIKPIIKLDTEEQQKGIISKKQIVIFTASSGARVPMANKEWFVERYQQLVDMLKNEYDVIQLGSKSDSPLTNVIDLRGKTTIRESAAILSNSMLMISHVGFMMHLARAVNCRAVIIYGGRERPDQSGYSCFKNIYNNTPCSPCWFHSTCSHERICMTEIHAEQVNYAVFNELKLYDCPLAIDVLNND